MQPPGWYTAAQESWNAEDWRMAEKAGEVQTTPYDPPPFEPDQSLGVIPPPPPQPSFGLFVRPRRRQARSTQSRAVDGLFEKVLGPR